jgi:uncharacterized protein
MTSKERSADPRRVEVQALCREAGVLHGEWSRADLPRLADSLLAIPGDVLPPPVTWRARGELRTPSSAQPECWLQLSAQTQVMLQCQRCLQPMSQALQVDRRYRFVADEDEAARLDDESEDDVLALPARLDLHELVEDELILALPIVPRHAVCPEPLRVADEPGAESAPHPFAALAVLRRPLPGDKPG